MDHFADFRHGGPSL